MEGRRVKSKFSSSSQLEVLMVSIRLGPLQFFIGDKAVSGGWFLACFPGRFQPEGFAV
jgi:hypothetical protein